MCHFNRIFLNRSLTATAYFFHQGLTAAGQDKPAANTHLHMGTCSLQASLQGRRCGMPGRLRLAMWIDAMCYARKGMSDL